MRVFLDTNVLVSAFATRGLCADVLQLVLSEHQLVLGNTVLTELTKVLRTKMGVPSEVTGETEGLLRREAEITSVASDPGLEIRDKDDVAVLGEALAGDAEVLITGDHDLLDVASKSPLRILSPREFWELLRSEDSAS